MDDGFIKLHRSMLGWEWYKNTNTKIVFMHLLLNANWEDSRFEGHEVPRGSLVTSYQSLAEDLGISVRSVRTALKHLKSTHEVTVKTTSRFSIIKVENWDKYQLREKRSDILNDTLSDSQATGKRQASDNIKEYKNIRNKEYYNKPKLNNSDLIKSNYNFEALRREINRK